MLEPPFPPDEAERIASLHALNILDTPDEERFDRITRIAAAAFEVPIALVSLVDTDRQWFKSVCGLKSRQTPRAISFCGHAILGRTPFVIPDALADPRFADNPLVTGPPHIRFYAGAPLDDGHGHRLGVLCVIDREPRSMSPAQLDLLRELAGWAEEELRSIGLPQAMLRYRENAAKVAAIIDALADGLVIFDNEGTIRTANSAAERMFGYSDLATAGHNIHELSPEPLYVPAAEQAAVPARAVPARAEPTARRESIGRRRDGRPFPMEVAVSKVRDSQERLFVAVLRDITETKRGERALRMSEARFRTLSEMAPVGIFQADLSGRCTFVNHRWCDIVGVGRAEAMGAPWDVAVHPDDAQRVRLEWDEASREGLEFFTELRFQAPDGRTSWASVNAITVSDAAGSPAGRLGTVQDITLPWLAQEALRQSEEIHSSVIAAMAEGVIIQDQDGAVIGWNVAAERILGLSSDQIRGWAAPDPSWIAERPDGSPFPADEHPALDTLRTGLPRTNVIMRVQRPDGRLRWISINSQPLVRAGDVAAAWGVVCTFADITDRLEVDRMKSEFVSVVSHELRTPLTSIRGALGLLAGGALGRLEPKPQQLVDIAVANTDRLVRLINDILDIERIESGQICLARKCLDAADLIHQAVDVMQPMADKAGVRLEVDAPAAEVWADPDRAIQTLTNLISNAVKYSPAGAVVRLSARRTGREIMFAVADRGRGIPEDKIRFLFRRFQQVDASDPREKGGTGLGLAICKSIVEQHGGRIWVESVAGEGSTFRFTLPAEEYAAPGGPDPDESGRAATRGYLVPCGDSPTIRSVEPARPALAGGGHQIAPLEVGRCA